MLLSAFQILAVCSASPSERSWSWQNCPTKKQMYLVSVHGLEETQVSSAGIHGWSCWTRRAGPVWPGCEVKEKSHRIPKPALDTKNYLIPVRQSRRNNLLREGNEHLPWREFVFVHKVKTCWREMLRWGSSEAEGLRVGWNCCSLDPAPSGWPCWAGSVETAGKKWVWRHWGRPDSARQKVSDTFFGAWHHIG